ncbi:MAG: carboxypeptidase M32 [Clostridia bacterium]|nr:carboxypeptidase M32 [Clostridia bacterium]
MEKFEKLLDYLKQVEYLGYTVAMLRWEMDTVASKKSYDYLIDVSTKYEIESFRLTQSNEYIELIEDVANSDEFNKLNEMQKHYLSSLKKDFYKMKNVPEEFYKGYCELRNKSLNSWVEAKEKNDYEIFKPYLIQIISETKKLYNYIYPDSTNLYDCMLNDYEEGIKSEQIDKLFTDLKEQIIPIIRNLKVNNEEKLDKKYTDEELVNFGKFLLEYIGFDNTRGALGIYTHGYTMKLNNNDVRITFSNDNDITDICSTIIHEGGHGIFEQNIDESLAKFYTYDIDKIALHESQSRFFENILGRNINFWKPIYNDVKEQLNLDIPIEDFVKMFNNARPSNIRTKADELTYCMHIIIRYELERAIFNGDVDFDKLPQMWNEKYKEYLGLDISNDAEGILQDMHWSEGAFGYFPSYLLGSIFDGMLLETINEKLGKVDQMLEQGRIREITKFLNENIHKYGGVYNINEVAKRVCGKELEVDGIVKYFNNKYGNIEK